MVRDHDCSTILLLLSSTQRFNKIRRCHSFRIVEITTASLYAAIKTLQSKNKPDDKDVKARDSGQRSLMLRMARMKSSSIADAKSSGLYGRGSFSEVDDDLC